MTMINTSAPAQVPAAAAAAPGEENNNGAAEGENYE